MVSKVVLIAAMIAYVEARFGQENVPIAAISAVQGGSAGAAATIGGATISDLLGGANACAKLTRADQIVTELGGGADAIAAAMGLVAAEKNTNPFANGNVQNVCGDASLPATPELRGITPLIDPAVDVNGDAAALSAQTLAAPQAADGMSVFDIMEAAGLGDLVVAQAAAGGAAAGGAAAGGAAAGGAAAGGNAGNANQGNAGNANQGNAGNANQGNAGNANQGNAGNANQGNANQGNAGNANMGNAGNNAGNNNNNNNNNNNAGNAAGNAGNNANQGNAGNANQGNANQGNAGNNANQNAGNNNAGNNAGNNNAGNNAGNNNAGGAAAGGAAAGGADFGQCTPTITFQGGEGNRPATEFTFQIADETARGGQGEALNPNIITNALCNQLTNVCDANAAAVTLCEDAKAQVEAAGTRNKSTADLFNTAMGFAGAVTNPAGGPDDVPAAARKMRRGLRA
jgi:hypothetical protein